MCTLLAFVDDATSRLMQLRFVASESAFDYFCANDVNVQLRQHPAELRDAIADTCKHRGPGELGPGPHCPTRGLCRNVLSESVAAVYASGAGKLTNILSSCLIFLLMRFPLVVS